MMSLFSSFDAFCAELYGQKVRFSLAGQRQVKDGPAAVEKFDKEGGAPSQTGGGPPKQQQQQQQPKIRPRFAPELDGVYCFETIVPY